MKYFLAPFKWFWYYILDPRGLFDFKKSVDEGFMKTSDGLKEVTGGMIQKKAEKRRRNEAKAAKKNGTK